MKKVGQKVKKTTENQALQKERKYTDRLKDKEIDDDAQKIDNLDRPICVQKRTMII